MKALNELLAKWEAELVQLDQYAVEAPRLGGAEEPEYVYAAQAEDLRWRIRQVREAMPTEPDAYLVQAVLDGKIWEHRWWVPRWGDPDPTPLHGKPYSMKGKEYPDMGMYWVKPFYAGERNE